MISFWPKIKPAVLLLNCCLLYLFATGQQWAPVGAKWHYTYMEDTWGAFGGPHYGYELMTAEKDTVMDGDTCSILERWLYTPGGDTLLSGREIIFTENSRVFHYAMDTFYLLYDFNSLAGDTLYIKGPYGETGGLDSILVTVDSTGVEYLSADTLKVLFTSSPQGEWYFGGKVMEKTGNLGHFFPQNYWGCDMGSCVAGLRCYNDSTLNYSSLNQVDCDYIYTTVKENLPLHSKYNVFPNPAKSRIFIENINGLTEIRVLNTLGQTVKTKKISSPSGSPVAVEIDLIPGTYLLQINNQNTWAVEQIMVH